MRFPLKSRRPSPAESLAIAISIAPHQPPAQVSAPALEATTTLNLRVRASTVAGLADAAKAQGTTMKQVLCHALQAAGVAVAPTDLEDRTPRRK